MCKKCEVQQAFANTLEELLGSVPADAGAVLLGKLALTLSREGPVGQRGLESLLQLTWMQIAAEFRKHIATTEKAADASAMLLERYFGLTGDWAAIVQSFEQDFAVRYPERLQWLAEQTEAIERVSAKAVAQQRELRATLN